MTFKDTYLLFVTDTDKPGKTGVGECALFKGLSAEDNSGYEQRLKWLCDNINRVSLDDIEDSSIRFGYETATRSLGSGRFLLHSSHSICGERYPQTLEC